MSILKKYTRNLLGLVLCLSLVLGTHCGYTQELNAQVTVIAPQLGTAVDASMVKDLEKQLTDFINHRKWSDDQFATEEKINCNFAIALTGIASQDVY